MKTKLSRLLFTLPFVTFLAGCSANFAPRAMEPAQVAGSPAPAVLDRSLFARDGSGSMSEGDLQRVLSTAIDLQLPARIGVVPLAEPFDPKGTVSIGTRSIAARDLASSLIGQPFFSHVSDISTDLPNTGGIEGLRLIAARYRLRYLLLYSERFVDDTHVNGWAWLYPTVIGMFVAPGVTVQSKGLLQADLFDVRTGTILFSVVQPMEVSETERMIGAGRAHKEHQAAAASAAAQKLAKVVARQVNELVAAADEAGQTERKVHLLPAPVMPQAAGSGTSVSQMTR